MGRQKSFWYAKDMALGSNRILRALQSLNAIDPHCTLQSSITPIVLVLTWETNIFFHFNPPNWLTV